MTAVTIVGMIGGAALLLTAILVFLMKKEFPAGGVGVTLIALVMIGMSQWSTIKIKGPGGIDIDLTQLRRQIEETAQAVDAVADVAGNNAKVTEGNRQQLLALTEQLGSRQVIAPAAAAAARNNLIALPKTDTTRLHSTRLNLKKVVPR